MHKVNLHTILSEKLKPSDALCIRVVAIIGFDNDWAAYAGPSEESDDEVAKSGDKISRVAAENLFYAPVAAGLHYRE